VGGAVASGAWLPGRKVMVVVLAGTVVPVVALVAVLGLVTVGLGAVVAGNVVGGEVGGRVGGDVGGSVSGGRSVV
jgi:hypothetical protein